jgi:hypothetical protein
VTTRPPVRSYGAIVRRLLGAVQRLPGGRLTQLGEARHGGRRYPLFQLTLTTGSRRPRGRRPLRLCVGAGSHGNEPAGVEGILQWLERLPALRRRLPPAELLIFPCLNPSGYVHDRRVNDDNIDLNRQYRNARAPIEVRVVQRALAGHRFDLSVEFHEDVDSPGFYLYELVEGVRPIGRRLIEAAARALPINHAGRIEGADAQAGLIHRNRRLIRERRTRWPHALYLFHLGTPRCLTFETPLTAPLGRRATVHARLLTLALQLSAAGH